MSVQSRSTRAARYNELAEKARQESDAASKRSHDLVSNIPFGQPILVGHHSEGRHRNALDKSWSALGKAVALDKKAADYTSKAIAAENNTAIFSDDPDGIAKLNEKLAELEAYQSLMVATNKLVRKKDRAAMLALGHSETNVDRLLSPDFCKRLGYPSYALQNNNATIRATKLRIDVLTAKQAAGSKETEFGDVTVREDVEIDRLQIIFPGKPSEAVRSVLKSFGFRWSPTNGAWQLHLSNRARYAAKQVLAACAAEVAP